MAYKSKDSLVYLFGGANEEHVLNDLWVLDSKEWRKVQTLRAPGPRTFAAMVYDHGGDRLVLFGGSKVLFGKGADSLNLLNDTWEFKNNQWKKLETVSAPTRRAESVMVYDYASQTILLFGGYVISNGEYVKLGDTWEYQNNDWTQVATHGPSPRHGVSMTYHRGNQEVMLFGGSTEDRQYGEGTGETWTWNGEKWSKLATPQPPGVFNASVAYDLGKKALLRFGGYDGAGRIDETWSFREGQWIELKTAKSPSPRNHSQMVYDEAQKRLVLFGGHDGKNVFGDTWVYQNENWELLSSSPPRERKKNGH